MILKRERASKKPRINNPAHVLQTFKERGRALFGTGKVEDMLRESFNHIYNYSRSVIIPDKREDTKSTHIAIFLTDIGNLVAIPLFIDEKYIVILTIKNIMNDENPNWYITHYNQVGEPKGLDRIPLKVNI